LFGARKEDAVSFPLLRHADRPQLLAQTFDGMRPDRFAAGEPGHPPVFHSIPSRSGEQEAPAVRSPDREPRERKIRLNPARLSPFRRDHENLAGAEDERLILRTGY